MHFRSNGVSKIHRKKELKVSGKVPSSSFLNEGLKTISSLGAVAGAHSARLRELFFPVVICFGGGGAGTFGLENVESHAVL